MTSSSYRWCGRRLGQATAAIAVAVLVVGMLSACRETKGGANPVLATAPPPSAEPALSPSPDPAPPPAETAAPQQLEADAWEQAEVDNTVVSYQLYLSTYPDGQFVKKAKRRIASLRKDEGPFLAAEKKGTLRAYETFLDQFPGHRRQDDARAALKVIRADTRGRDVAELVAEGKIELQVRGSDITRVTVRLRRLVKHAVRVRIPAGALFASGSSSVQDMLALEQTNMLLEGKRWVSVDIEAACADISAAIPGKKDAFSVSQASGELRRIARRLRSEEDTAVRQAAVWIVSDNANYFALGTLIYATGARVIGDEEAARAMKLVDDAGIDIRSRTIWLDRQGIASGLPKGPLKKWLLQ